MLNDLTFVWLSLELLGGKIQIRSKCVHRVSPVSQTYETDET